MRENFFEGAALTDRPEKTAGARKAVHPGRFAFSEKRDDGGGLFEQNQRDFWRTLKSFGDFRQD